MFKLCCVFLVCVLKRARGAQERARAKRKTRSGEKTQQFEFGGTQMPKGDDSVAFPWRPHEP